MTSFDDENFVVVLNNDGLLAPPQAESTGVAYDVSSTILRDLLNENRKGLQSATIHSRLHNDAYLSFSRVLVNAGPIYEARGKVSFRGVDSIIDIRHVFVPEAMRGNRIAESLVLKALSIVRELGLKFRPSCSYVSKKFSVYHEEIFNELLHFSFTKNGKLAENYRQTLMGMSLLELKSLCVELNTGRTSGNRTCVIERLVQLYVSNGYIVKARAGEPPKKGFGAPSHHIFTSSFAAAGAAAASSHSHYSGDSNEFNLSMESSKRARHEHDCDDEHDNSDHTAGCCCCGQAGAVSLSDLPHESLLLPAPPSLFTHASSSSLALPLSSSLPAMPAGIAEDDQDDHSTRGNHSV